MANTVTRAPRPFSQRSAVPFDGAEQAWLWFWRCQLAREDGARFVADAGAEARPCDPDDIYRVMQALYRQNRLGKPHLRVLMAFGRHLTPPDGRLEEQATAARLWEEGLLRLGQGLRAKGLVVA